MLICGRLVRLSHIDDLRPRGRAACARSPKSIVGVRIGGIAQILQGQEGQ